MVKRGEILQQSNGNINIRCIKEIFNTDILVKLMEDHKTEKQITAEESGLYMFSLFGIMFTLKQRTLNLLIVNGLKKNKNSIK